MTIALLLLATRKYKEFVQPLLEDVKKYFLPSHKIQVHLFADDVSIEYYGDERVSIIKELIPAYRFPIITLYRYKIFTSKEYSGCDYLFYLDVDMSICSEVGDEVLGGITAVLHPGFYNGGGSWGNNRESTSYTLPENREKYYAGGFQGGSHERYYPLMKQLASAIEYDERRNILAEWHDESHLNRALSEMTNINILTPDYCMVEQFHLRLQWGVSHFDPKIIALEKDHESIR